MKTPDPAKALVQQLAEMLDGSKAHATLVDATEDFPEALRGVVPEGLPYSAWQIVEHIRVAQRDILEYIDNADGSYKPMQWPADYWLKSPVPPSAAAWEEAVKGVLDDRAALEALLLKADLEELVRPFPRGEGQTLLKDVLLVIDHCGYHVGELIVIRRLLRAWRS
jgi:hypothetical protein